MDKHHGFKVGDTVLLKVGRNEAQVRILKPIAGGSAFMVRSLASGREFIMPGARLNVPIVSITAIEPKPEAPVPAPVEPETEDAATPAPARKMSLMDAAAAVLKESGEPMNTREMVKAAVEKAAGRPPVRRPRSRRCTAASSGRSRPPRSPASDRARSAGGPSNTPRNSNLHRQPLTPRGFFTFL